MRVLLCRYYLVGCNSATEKPTEEVKPPAEKPVEEIPEETATLPEREPTMDVVLSVEGEDSTITDGSRRRQRCHVLDVHRYGTLYV